MLNNDMAAVTTRFEKLGFETSGELSSEDSSQTVKKGGAIADFDQKWQAEFEASPEVMAIRSELEEYNRRKKQQTLYIALFGDISSGKSSLIKALISHTKGSDEEKAPVIETSVIGGTTCTVNHYHWTRNEAAEQYYVLTDMPGLNEQLDEQVQPQGNGQQSNHQQVAEHDILAAAEVRRAHIVIYLCDGDLTATQFDELKALLLLSKPCIVALNKSDRYNEADRQLIINRIQTTVNQATEDMAAEKLLVEKVPVLSIRAGGTREMIRLTPNGEEERVQRPIKPDIRALQKQLYKMMQDYGVDQLEQLREKSVASMINDKLDELDVMYKHSQSRQLVISYTNKAMVAALATISPGTDLLVQGYLGIHMIKDLCKIYDVPASDIDANKLIKLIQSRMKKTLPLLLAIAGNGFKAFPGIGTVTGGLMHAVAYGMIFDTLGRSVARTLEVTGELSPVLVSDLYKEQLSETIESRTKDYIKMVLKLRKNN